MSRLHGTGVPKNMTTGLRLLLEVTPATGKRP
jgi:hypothetical protein